ncbi:hypothetical protein EEZ25_17955 [Micromonospora aurantiaca]|nr:hypothetical protein EEZ25_17955 [Micromonospora aurantiaca]
MGTGDEVQSRDDVMPRVGCQVSRPLQRQFRARLVLVGQRRGQVEDLRGQVTRRGGGVEQVCDRVTARLRQYDPAPVYSVTYGR